MPETVSKSQAAAREGQLAASPERHLRTELLGVYTLCISNLCAYGSPKGILASLNSRALGLHILRVYFSMHSHLL